VDLLGSHAGPDVVLQQGQYLGREPAGNAHAFEFFRGFGDDGHNESGFSGARSEIPALGTSAGMRNNYPPSAPGLQPPVAPGAILAYNYPALPRQTAHAGRHR